MFLFADLSNQEEKKASLRAVIGNVCAVRGSSEITCKPVVNKQNKREGRRHTVILDLEKSEQCSPY